MRTSFKIFTTSVLATLFVLFGWLTLAGAEAGGTGLTRSLPEPVPTEKVQEEKVQIYFFGREDCKFCQKEKVFFESFLPTHLDVELVYYDIVEDAAAKGLFDSVTEANDLSKITPLTLVGGRMIQGYNSDITTGAQIESAAIYARDGNNIPVEGYIEKREVVASGSGCSDDPDASECEVILNEDEFVFELPFLGVVNLEEYSLFALASVLGVIDGFNPCAMWVLVTFLLVLMQIGDRRKMFMVAGLFILAEAITYYLILNVWAKTWDFVGLDALVTPLIGLLAVGSGIYFLRKYWKTKDQLICDVTDLEEQTRIEKKITELVHSPFTFATVIGVLGVALSVNVIEFACSIGIPQAFTKILDLNMLDFWTLQWYNLVYIIGYMVDDLVVFGFALYGIDKLHHSQQYSKYSTLVGGILMLILGVLLLLNPDFLVM